MKIKISGIKTAFELENFEFTFGKKELKQITKRNRKNRADEDYELRKENEELRKRLNDAHSQLGDMRKQLEAARMDAMRR